MGSTQSTVQEEQYARAREEWLKPIESGEQLRGRYQDVLGTVCLHPEEQAWLETIFNKFASTPGLWSESDLTFFLALSFPEPSTQLLRDASPVLYRLLLHVGAYPYEQGFTHGLDLKTLRTAVILLIGNDHYHLCQSDVDGRANEHAARIHARYLRLIFKGLASTSDNVQNEGDVSGDEDIVEVLSVIARRPRLRHPTNPKIAVPAPQLPSPSIFPVSNFNGLASRLKRKDVWSLTRLILACQLSWAGSGPASIVASSTKEFNKAAHAILIVIDFDHNDECCWQEFKRVMSPQQVGIRLGMQRVFKAVIKKPETLSAGTFDTLSAAEAAKCIQFEYKSYETGISPPGEILNLSLLSQLAMFLPEVLPLNKMKLVNLSEAGPNKVQMIKSRLEQSSQGTILLVSGETLNEDEFESGHVECGMYMPPTSSHEGVNPGEPTIFQCRPSQQVWSGIVHKGKSTVRGGLTSPDIMCWLTTSGGIHADFDINSTCSKIKVGYSSKGSSETENDAVRAELRKLEIFVVPLD